MSPRETEIKLPLTDADSAVQMIMKLPARILDPRQFEDNFVFDFPDNRLRDSGKLLRARIVNHKAILTFKDKVIISDGVKDREEIESMVDPGDSLIQILEKLGYVMMFRYQKYRTVYELEGYTLHLCLDETPIGTYLELEGDIQDIHRCAAELGYSRDQYITESYGGLYSRWCREHNIRPSHMIFE